MSVSRSTAPARTSVRNPIHRAVITGDLMHHPIQCALPDVSSKYDHDVSRARDTRHDFLNRYADDEVLVLGTHFAAPTAGRIVSHGDSWQFQVD